MCNLITAWLSTPDNWFVQYFTQSKYPLRPHSTRVPARICSTKWQSFKSLNSSRRSVANRVLKSLKLAPIIHYVGINFATFGVESLPPKSFERLSQHSRSLFNYLWRIRTREEWHLYRQFSKIFAALFLSSLFFRFFFSSSPNLQPYGRDPGFHTWFNTNFPVSTSQFSEIFILRLYQLNDLSLPLLPDLVSRSR